MRKVNIEDYITVDQNVCHGKPVFKGTRIMLHLVLEMLAGGETVDDVLKAYPSLTREAVEAGLLFAAHTCETGERHIEFPTPHETAH